MSVERGSLSLMSTTEELFGRNNTSSGLESKITAVGIRHADHVTLFYLKKLTQTSPTSGGSSIGIVLADSGRGCLRGQ
jgi:hypothetical protein